LKLHKIEERTKKEEEQLHFLKKSEIILVLVTNKEFTGDIPLGCGIISKQKFSKFFGPFGEISAFYAEELFTPIIDINNDDDKELQRIIGVGEKSSAKIMKLRSEQPFKSANDLIQRIPELTRYEEYLSKCKFTLTTSMEKEKIKSKKRQQPFEKKSNEGKTIKKQKQNI